MEASETTLTDTPETAAPTGEQVTPEGQTTDQMLAQLIADQKEHRAEIAQLRDEVSRARGPAPVTTTVNVPSAEERLEARLEEIKAHSHYCPACGRLSNFLRECTGHPTAGHPPLEMVSTDELTAGDSAKHTPAPVSE